MAGWELVSVQRMSLHRSNRLAQMYVLSPYVWHDGERYRLMIRAVPRRDDDPRLKMAEIWHGSSADGLYFDMDPMPIIFPGPDLADLDGCEDPTVRIDGGVTRVWYTGYNERQKMGRLLMARGPDVARLHKCGIVIDASEAFENPKECTVAALGDDRWRMFFEYARGDASLIGQADTSDLDGPWSDPIDSPLAPRPDSWDRWHLSTGPIVGEGGAEPTMFYNGATQDAKWRIGWATFDQTLERIVARCDAPLITPEAMREGTGTDIAFAASAVERDGEVRLYYSLADQDLRCAVVRRT